MLIYCIRWKGRSTTQLQDHIGSFVQGGTIKIDLQQALHVHVSAQAVRNGLCEGGVWGSYDHKWDLCSRFSTVQPEWHCSREPLLTSACCILQHDQFGGGSVTAQDKILRPAHVRTYVCAPGLAFCGWCESGWWWRHWCYWLTRPSRDQTSTSIVTSTTATATNFTIDCS